MSELQEYIEVKQYVMDISQWFMDMLLVWNSKREGIDLDNKVVEDLTNHMKKGGKIACWSFPDDDIDYVKKMLDKQGITYMEMESVNPDTKKVIKTFFFKDTDLNKVKSIADSHLKHLDEQCHEIPLFDFFAIYGEKPFYKTTNLTKEEVEVFRSFATEHNMDFAVERSAEDNKAERTYTIYSNNKELTDKGISLYI